MNAVRMMRDVAGLSRSLRLCGVSKRARHRAPKPGSMSPDPEVQSAILDMAPKRPACGARRMAARASGGLRRPVNRRAVRRTFGRPGRSLPARTRKEIARSGRKAPRPDGPDEFWEPGMPYTWCGAGGRCCCSNAIDAFAGQWTAFVLGDGAARRGAVMAVGNAAAAAGPKVPAGPTPRADNGSRYTGRGLRSSAAAPGTTLERICVSTPGQNGRIESLHKALKKEYVRPRESADLQEARRAMQEALGDCNSRRTHSSPGCATPSKLAALRRRQKAGGGPESKRIFGGGRCE